MAQQPDRNQQAIDDATGGTYPEWLYRYAAIDTAGVSGLDVVGEAEVRSFHERGYLVVHDAFTPAETQAALLGCQLSPLLQPGRTLRLQHSGHGSPV